MDSRGVFKVTPPDHVTLEPIETQETRAVEIAARMNKIMIKNIKDELY